MTAVVPLSDVDDAALLAFFDRVPERDRTFFRDDVGAPGVVQAWRADGSGRLVALEDGRVLGVASVVPGVGWMSHVGELRVVVDPADRRRGLGRELARAGLVAALEMGLTKVTVQVAADDEPTAAMFSAMGFEAEALLTDHIRDRQGRPHDLLVLAHRAGDTWSSMTTVGVADEVDAGAEPGS